MSASFYLKTAAQLMLVFEVRPVTDDFKDN